MNEIIIEHVPVADLPSAWRARLTYSAGAQVTVRIEEEAPVAASAENFTTDDPAFGIWRDRDDVVDVDAHVRRLRAPRFTLDGTSDAP